MKEKFDRLYKAMEQEVCQEALTLQYELDEVEKIFEEVLDFITYAKVRMKMVTGISIEKPCIKSEKVFGGKICLYTKLDAASYASHQDSNGKWMVCIVTSTSEISSDRRKTYCLFNGGITPIKQIPEKLIKYEKQYLLEQI